MSQLSSRTFTERRATKWATDKHQSFTDKTLKHAQKKKPSLKTHAKQKENYKSSIDPQSVPADCKKGELDLQGWCEKRRETFRAWREETGKQREDWSSNCIGCVEGTAADARRQRRDDSVLHSNVGSSAAGTSPSPRPPPSSPV